MTAIRNGVWLDAQVFSEPAWVVPGIIPEGCCILAGRPKIGKSFLVLEIALAVAAGTQVLGVDVEQRPVLYLALEDNERRLQRRARALLDDEPLPPTTSTASHETSSSPRWNSLLAGFATTVTANRSSSSTRWRRFVRSEVRASTRTTTR